MTFAAMIRVSLVRVPGVWVALYSLLLGMVSAARGDASLTSLVERHKEWRGGEAFVVLSGLELNGRLSAGGLEGSYRLRQTPTARRVDIDLGPYRRSDGLQDDLAWTLTPSGQRETSRGARVQEARQAGAVELGKIWQAGRSDGVLSRQPDEERAGRSWAVVRASFEDENTYDHFIDASTGALYGIRQTVDGSVEFISFGDWREVDGVRIPFRRSGESATPAENWRLVVENVRVNPTLAPELFAPPAVEKHYMFSDGKHTTGPLPFELFDRTRILVPLEIDGQPRVALLDSGAEVSVIDQQAAKELGLTSQGGIPVSGTGGTDTGSLASDVPIRLGPLNLRLKTALLLDMKPLAQRLERPLPMVLGKDALHQLVVELDFTRRIICFTDPAHFTVPAGAERIPLSPRGGLRTVPIQIENGPVIEATFDLGNGSYVIVGSTYAAKHGLVQNRPASRRVGGGVGGIRESTVTTAKSLTFGQTRLENVPVTVPDPGLAAFDSKSVQANVGMSVLQRFRLFIHMDESTLYVIPQKESLAESLAKDRSGLALLKEKGEALVVFVSPGSPAEKSGWKKDDRILAIDGVPVADSKQPLTSFGESPAGTRVRYTPADGSVRELILSDYF